MKEAATGVLSVLLSGFPRIKVHVVLQLPIQKVRYADTDETASVLEENILFEKC